MMTQKISISLKKLLSRWKNYMFWWWPKNFLSVRKSLSSGGKTTWFHDGPKIFLSVRKSKFRWKNYMVWWWPKIFLSAWKSLSSGGKTTCFDDDPKFFYQSEKVYVPVEKLHVLMMTQKFSISQKKLKSRWKNYMIWWWPKKFRT